MHTNTCKTFYEYGSYTNGIFILVQKIHTNLLWSKDAKNEIGLFYICKWYYYITKLQKVLQCKTPIEYEKIELALYTGKSS